MFENWTRRRLKKLLTTDLPKRDASWERKLASWLPRALFDVIAVPEPVLGTLDYLPVSLVDGNAIGQTFADIVDRALQSGLGITVAVGGIPAVQMSFSVLATYRMFKNWRSPIGWNGGPVSNGSEIIRRSEVIRTGAPNEEYLPLFIRAAIRRHLESVGVKQPRVLLVMWPERSNHRDLAFSIRRADFAPQVYAGLMQSLMWFLPEGYQCIAWEAVEASEASAVPL